MNIFNVKDEVNYFQQQNVTKTPSLFSDNIQITTINQMK